MKILHAILVTMILWLAVFVAGWSPGAGTSTIQDEGTSQGTAATIFNFTGTGITATYSAGTATVNVPGGVGGVSGSGTEGTLPVWSAAAALTNSLLSQNTPTSLITATADFSPEADTTRKLGENLSTGTRNMRWAEVNAVFTGTDRIQSAAGDNVVEMSSHLDPLTNNSYRLGSSTANYSTANILRLLTSDGSASLPPYTSDSDPNTGMYFPQADLLAFTAGGVARLQVGIPGVITATANVRPEANLTYELGDTALRWLQVWAQTVEGTTLNMADGNFTGRVLLADGLITNPSFGFTSDPDTGIYRVGINNMALVAAAARRIDIAGDSALVTITADLRPEVDDTRSLGGTDLDWAVLNVNTLQDSGDSLVTVNDDLAVSSQLNFDANGVGNFVSRSFPTLYASSGTAGAPFPFAESGHLILEPRLGGAQRDVIVYSARATDAAEISFGIAVTNTAAAGGAGLGSNQYFYAEDSASTMDSQVALESTWNSATNGAEASTLKAYVKTGGAFAERLALGPSAVTVTADTFNASGYVTIGTTPRTLGDVQGVHQGLQCSNLTPTSVQVTATYALLLDTNNVPFQARTVAGTIDLTLNGAVNRLDTGTVAANTWYAIWLISDGTTTGGLGSLSDTAPTMPSGYTYRERVGSFRTDAAGNPIDFLQIGKLHLNTCVDKAAHSRFVSGSSHSSSYTNAALANFIAPASRMVLCSGQSAANVDGASVEMKPAGKQEYTFFFPLGPTNSKHGFPGTPIATNDDRQIQYKVSDNSANTSLILEASGYYEP